MVPRAGQRVLAGGRAVRGPGRSASGAGCSCAAPRRWASTGRPPGPACAGCRRRRSGVRRRRPGPSRRAVRRSSPRAQGRASTWWPGPDRACPAPPARESPVRDGHGHAGESFARAGQGVRRHRGGRRALGAAQPLRHLARILPPGIPRGRRRLGTRQPRRQGRHPQPLQQRLAPAPHARRQSGRAGGAARAPLPETASEALRADRRDVLPRGLSRWLAPLPERPRQLAREGDRPGLPRRPHPRPRTRRDEDLRRRQTRRPEVQAGVDPPRQLRRPRRDVLRRAGQPLRLRPHRREGARLRSERQGDRRVRRGDAPSRWPATARQAPSTSCPSRRSTRKARRCCGSSAPSRTAPRK